MNNTPLPLITAATRRRPSTLPRTEPSPPSLEIPPPDHYAAIDQVFDTNIAILHKRDTITEAQMELAEQTQETMRTMLKNPRHRTFFNEFMMLLNRRTQHINFNTATTAKTRENKK